MMNFKKIFVCILSLAIALSLVTTPAFALDGESLPAEELQVENSEASAETKDFESAVENNIIISPSEPSDRANGIAERPQTESSVEAQAVEASVAAPAPIMYVDYSREWFYPLDATKEYRIDGGSWVRASEAVLPLQGTPYLYGKTVEVRIAETSTAPASDIAVVTVLPVGYGTTPPNLVYNPNTNMITGLNSTMEYKKDWEILWSKCSGNMNVAALRSYNSDVKLEFRYRGIASTVPPSVITEIVLPKIFVPQLDPVALDIENEMITNLDPSKQYLFYVGSTASGAFGSYSAISISQYISTTSPVTIKVQEMDSGTMVATFTIEKRPAAPNISFAYNQEADKYVASGWSNIEANLSSQWIYLPNNNGAVAVPDNDTTCSLRYKATGNTPASTVQTVTLAGRAAAPSTSLLSYVNETITGLADTMEYRIGSENWLDVTGTSFSFADAVPSMYGKTVSIRTKSTATSPASKAKEITLLKQGAAPVLGFNPVAMSVNTTTTMQYRVKGESMWSACAAGMSVSAFDGQTLEFRYTGVSNTQAPSLIKEIPVSSEEIFITKTDSGEYYANNSSIQGEVCVPERTNPLVSGTVVDLKGNLNSTANEKWYAMYVPSLAEMSGAAVDQDSQYYQVAIYQAGEDGKLNVAPKINGADSLQVGINYIRVSTSNASENYSFTISPQSIVHRFETVSIRVNGSAMRKQDYSYNMLGERDALLGGSNVVWTVKAVTASGAVATNVIDDIWIHIYDTAWIYDSPSYYKNGTATFDPLTGIAVASTTAPATKGQYYSYVTNSGYDYDARMQLTAGNETLYMNFIYITTRYLS